MFVRKINTLIYGSIGLGKQVGVGMIRRQTIHCMKYYNVIVVGNI